MTPNLWRSHARRSFLRADNYKWMRAATTSTLHNFHKFPIDELLKQHGLNAQSQDIVSVSGNLTCTNYHVVTPSSRGSGSESMALVTPIARPCGPEEQQSLGSYREPCWPQSRNGGAMAFMLGLTMSKYLARVPWLARDFYWIIPDATCGLLHSTQAWIDGARGYTEVTSMVHGLARVGLLQQVPIPTSPCLAMPRVSAFGCQHVRLKHSRMSNAGLGGGDTEAGAGQQRHLGRCGAVGRGHPRASAQAGLVDAAGTLFSAGCWSQGVAAVSPYATAGHSAGSASSGAPRRLPAASAWHALVPGHATRRQP
jgi:hypothetical protein